MWERLGRLAALAQKETKEIPVQRLPLLWQALPQAQQVQPRLLPTKAQRLPHRLDLPFRAAMWGQPAQLEAQETKETKEIPVQRPLLLLQALPQAQQVQPHLLPTRAQHLPHRLDLPFRAGTLAQRGQLGTLEPRVTKATPAALQQ